MSFGFATQQEADDARTALGGLAVPEHTLTAAWAAHEAWDQANAEFAAGSLQPVTAPQGVFADERDERRRPGL